MNKPFRNVLSFAGALMVALLLAQWPMRAASNNRNQNDAGTQAKVDLNSATEKQLEDLPGIGPASAKKIIAGRPYSSPMDLSKTGISSKTIDKITPLVMAGGTSTVPAAAAPPPSVQPAPAQSSKPPTSASKTTTAQTPPPSNSQGMVWVNLDSGIYHYPNSRYYGKTKSGKYMSESDAVSAGYHAAANEHKPQ